MPENQIKIHEANINQLTNSLKENLNIQEKFNISEKINLEKEFLISLYRIKGGEITLEEFISTVIRDTINFGQFSEDFKAGKLKDYNMSYQKYQEY